MTSNQIEKMISRERKKYLKIGVEKGIVDVVVMLQLYGFPTSGSCEGHVRKKSSAFPWVYFVVECTRQGKDRFMCWRKKTEGLIYRLNVYLEEFYKTRNVPADQMLQVFHDTPSRVIPFADFRLRSAGVCLWEILPQELLAEEVHQSILFRYREEMSAFAEFLKMRN